VSRALPARPFRLSGAGLARRSQPHPDARGSANVRQYSLRAKDQRSLTDSRRAQRRRRPSGGHRRALAGLRRRRTGRGARGPAACPRDSGFGLCVRVGRLAVSSTRRRGRCLGRCAGRGTRARPRALRPAGVGVAGEIQRRHGLAALPPSTCRALAAVRRITSPAGKMAEAGPGHRDRGDVEHHGFS
jgi:hypothetical protein